jgi:hypothetical protein
MVDSSRLNKRIQIIRVTTERDADGYEQNSVTFRAVGKVGVCVESLGYLEEKVRAM